MNSAKAHELTDLRKVYRLWLGISFVFMMLSGALAGGVILHRAIGLEQEQRQTMLQMLALHLERDYPKLAEETYLHLGTISRRTVFYQELLKDKARFTLRFDDQTSDLKPFTSNASRPT